MKFKNQLIICSRENIIDISIPYEAELIQKIDIKTAGNDSYPFEPRMMDFIYYGEVHRYIKDILNIETKNSPKSEKLKEFDQLIRIVGYKTKEENKIINLFSKNSIVLGKIDTFKKSRLVQSISSDLEYLESSGRVLGLTYNRLNSFYKTDLKANLNKNTITTLNKLKKQNENSIILLKLIAEQCFLYFKDNFITSIKGVNHD